ncbi:hypothetical protein [Methanococcus voltae]|uniref:hypothetical protein n=1 Tax=Methanococcus voltae TaxID=2188 RepID=UPI001AE43550|nr:hypothetical protein [Methanococcus voltae]
MKYDGMTEVSQIVQTRAMTKLQFFLERCCNDDEKDLFIERRAETFAMKNPAKIGFVLQATKDNETWTRYKKRQEIKRLQKD